MRPDWRGQNEAGVRTRSKKHSKEIISTNISSFSQESHTLHVAQPAAPQSSFKIFENYCLLLTNAHLKRILNVKLF